ncbi:hypothetical protein TNCV_1082371 [Trichonephila clavipes]|nr:hypothetical protein TNCV_1082371 [Trichonephila clavipes]
MDKNERGRKSLGDVERSELPNTATTDENIANQMVLDDRRIKVRDSRGYEHVKRTCLSHIKSTFRLRKAVRVSGAAFAHVRPKRMSISNALLAQFWRQLIAVDPCFSNCGARPPRRTG